MQEILLLDCDDEGNPNLRRRSLSLGSTSDKQLQELGWMVPLLIEELKEFHGNVLREQRKRHLGEQGYPKRPPDYPPVNSRAG